MCITTTGQVIELKKKNALINVEGQRIQVKTNPMISIEKGDKVMIFKNFIIDKV